jgi:DUF1680 family protein
METDITSNLSCSEESLSREINKRNKFIPLKLGQIIPESWVKAEGEKATAEGGLANVKSILRNNIWMTPEKITKKGPFGWWPYEQQGYYLDGATRTALMMRDEKLLSKLKKTYDAVTARSEADETGYFFCDLPDYKQDWANGRDEGNDSTRWHTTGVEGMYWSLAVFCRGLLAEYEATGDKRCLKPLSAYSHHYYNKGRDKEFQGKLITGHELYMNRGLASLGPIVEYIRLTGDKAACERAVEIFRNNEDGMVRNYLSDTYSTVCHGVTYNELTKLYAIGYILTGNKNYLKASVNAYEYIQENHMQPIGVHSSQEFLLGICGSVGTETCDVSDFIWSNLWMLRATGKGKYADRIERAFYNAGQQMVSKDYKTHVYFQMPNQIPGGVDALNKDTVKHLQYRKQHEPICCSRNLTRVLPNFAGHACMATHDGLAMIFYIPSDVSVKLNGKDVGFKVITEYPFNGETKIIFTNKKPVSFPMKFRIPEWCSAPTFRVNGKNVKKKIDKDRFVTLDGSWKKGTSIEIDFPMTAEMIVTHEHRILNATTGRDGHVSGHGSPAHWTEYRETVPFACVKRGPLTFALPLEDTADAQVALAVKHKKDMEVNLSPVPDGWKWGDESPVTIQVKARKINWKFSYNRLPNRTYAADKEPLEKITLVPYGSTGFHRLTMFPVAK